MQCLLNNNENHTHAGIIYVIEVEPIVPASSNTIRRLNPDMAREYDNTTRQTVTAENKANPAESGETEGTPLSTSSSGSKWFLNSQSKKKKLFNFQNHLQFKINQPQTKYNPPNCLIIQQPHNNQLGQLYSSLSMQHHPPDRCLSKTKKSWGSSSSSTDVNVLFLLSACNGSLICITE